MSLIFGIFWLITEPGEASTVFTMFGTDISKALGQIDWMIVKVTQLGEGRGCEIDLCQGGTCLRVPPQLHRWRLQGVVRGPPSGLCGEEEQALCPGQDGGLSKKCFNGNQYSKVVPIAID